jgi:hypothetical protein
MGGPVSGLHAPQPAAQQPTGPVAALSGETYLAAATDGAQAPGAPSAELAAALSQTAAPQTNIHLDGAGSNGHGSGDSYTSLASASQGYYNLGGYTSQYGANGDPSHSMAPSAFSDTAHAMRYGGLPGYNGTSSAYSDYSNYNAYGHGYGHGYNPGYNSLLGSFPGNGYRTLIAEPEIIFS